MKESKFELKHFNNNEFGQLDILIENGKEYFPAVDIAKILGYKDPEKAVTTHCKHPTIIKRPVGVVTGKKKMKQMLYKKVNKNGVTDAYLIINNISRGAKITGLLNNRTNQILQN